MASITDHVIKLQELTQQNLEILQALNDSFFTNQNHLSVRVGDNQYAIPSFISLENRINSLTANFENLVNAPETGEAFFDFNGNSRAINVRSYTSTPASLTLDPVTDFNIDQNDIFKDFLTPSPYVNLGVQALPNDTTEVVVKKVIPLCAELKSLFKSYLTDTIENQTVYKSSIKYNYKDLFKILDLYKQDVDYIEYDTRVDLPIRKNVGSGLYVIEEIVEDIVDENLDNFITIKFRTDVDDVTCMSSLKYRLFDETIEKMLKVGDQLVTFEGNAKMEITEVRPITNTVVVKVLYGEFLNLVPSTTNNMNYVPSLSKIKFYSPIDFNEDKYVKVPLEEDQYIFVSVAALNSRMNIQSPWGGGLMLNTFALKNGDKDFKTYYDENVRNVGDVLYEITSLMSNNTLMKYSKEEYEEFTRLEPVININNIQVVRINDHLDNSVAVQNIRSLHSQKVNLQQQINEKQTKIDEISAVLTTISFDDTTGQRQAYTSQLTSLNTEKRELQTAYTKITNEIAKSANDSEVPIENAKYRIRGFFDTAEAGQPWTKWDEHIVGIRVQYRYKNVDLEQNHAYTINDKFVFSDWNEMASSDRQRIPLYKDGSYKSIVSTKTDNINEPSFNQIDIPISQGETVDIRLKLIYDFGAPFVQTSSNWSQIVNVSFPQEYLKDIKILDIIEENNNDIETNRFNNIIVGEGIPQHVGDKITDQDITYFHKPENIASGFYTTERRIIPLKDKLLDLSNAVQQLRDEISGETGQLTVSIKHGGVHYKLTPFVKQTISLEQYSTFINLNQNNTKVGEYVYNNGVVSTVLHISLCNESNHVVKLYSQFPGKRKNPLNKAFSSKFDLNDYCENKNDKGYISYGGVWFECPGFSKNNMPIESELLPANWPVESDSVTGANVKLSNISLQTNNQFLYFRIKDLYGSQNYYHWVGETTDNDNLLSLGTNSNEPTLIQSGIKYLVDSSQRTDMYMYPKLTKPHGLCVDSDDMTGCLTVHPNEELIIPVVVEYSIGASNKDEIEKTMSFDIWTSLYKEPVNYVFQVSAKKEKTSSEQILDTQKQTISSKDSKYNIIYR